MSEQAVDFTALADAVASGPQVGASDLLITGGILQPDPGQSLAVLLEQFLASWDFSARAMPYAIWESMSQIVFVQDELPAVYGELVRGRVFGVDGDLSLRCSAGQARWWFIGPLGAALPKGYLAEKYWDSHPYELFYRRIRHYVLWGSRGENQEKWSEPRVGQADLRYPIAFTERVRVRVWEYTRRGRVEFAWFTGLEEYKE